MRLLLRFCVALAFPAITLQPAPSAAQECRILLPHPKEKKSDCGPRAAAAYDFAFCSLSYQIQGHAAPQPGKGDPEAFKRKGAVYAQLSEALSGRAAFQKNTEFAKRYFDSLKSQGEMIGPSLEYVRRSCDGVEQQHRDTIDQLAREYRGKK